MDLGDIPKSIQPKKQESEQMFVIPKSCYPNSIVVRYTLCKPQYKLKTLKAKYLKSEFLYKGVTYEELQSTVMKASAYLMPYRGYISKLEKISLGIIFGGIFGVIMGCILLGFLAYWAYSLILMILYIILSIVSMKLIKKASSKYLRQANFMLALFCRAENNRKYLHHNIEMRPGYLGKWIEFTFFEQVKDRFQLMNYRWEEVRKFKAANDLIRQNPNTIAIQAFQNDEQIFNDHQLALFLQMQEDNIGIATNKSPYKIMEDPNENLEESKQMDGMNQLKDKEEEMKEESDHHNQLQ